MTGNGAVEALLEYEPDGYEPFIDKSGRKVQVNRAAALIAEHNLDDDTQRAFEQVLEERDVYSGNLDVGERLRDTVTKAKVYDRILDEFENPSDAAGKVHHNSGSNLADMQLKEQFGLDSREACHGHTHWTMATDLEMSPRGYKGGYIMGHGDVAHTILRYIDGKEEITREEASEAIDEQIDRGDINIGNRTWKEEAILESLIEEDNSIDVEDYREWRKSLIE